MRERLTGTLIMGYIVLMTAFAMLTLTNANGQYIQQRDEKLPSFTYYTLDGNEFTEGSLIKNSKLMIVYFNPACEVCQEETAEILTNIDYFKDIQIVMVSPNTREELALFTKRFNLNKYPQITMLHDPEDIFYKQFHATGYPSLYLYDEKKNLIENFTSITEIDEIKEAFGAGVAKK